MGQPEPVTTPSLHSGRDSFLVPRNARLLWALRNTVSRHGPTGTEFKGHSKAETQAEPVPQEPGLLGSPFSWQSPRRRLAPLPPPRAAGQPRAVWLPPPGGELKPNMPQQQQQWQQQTWRPGASWPLSSSDSRQPGEGPSLAR
ncbi:psoriasis susceptibility 1 candidate gene 2 protein-like [Hippopotamus amphibius kiboko]|uniref:psoriasis susceptibility 1 candidate gene 2 protein-like n=1 Tax=Hippopotamus amphibius kiboko TaxID=575201 RepID=UPI002595E05C|nr:psoriasis susceptibility 1 candidate gene 2 protein-like [Hippopotamus amphibius kiboko]